MPPWCLEEQGNKAFNGFMVADRHSTDHATPHKAATPWLVLKQSQHLCTATQDQLSHCSGFSPQTYFRIGTFSEIY